MTDKIKSQTFQKITKQQDVKDMLNQPNISLKNNKGIFKERHGGLTFKLLKTNNINNQQVNDDLSENEIFYDALDNIDTEEIVQTQTETTVEKNTENFSKYTYNSVTILEDKKAKQWRKEIFNLKKLLNNVKDDNKKLSNEIQKNNFDLKTKYKELSNEIKNKANSNNTDWNKTWFNDKNIKDIEKVIFSIAENNKELFKKNNKNNNKIKKFEINIYQLNQKLDKYINELSIPTTPPALWIDKSDKVAQLHKKIQKVTTDKEFYKIRKKIEKLDNKMIKIWDGKKVEQIYEEILPIEDKMFFITTFMHANQSISEETIFFHNFDNNNFEIVKQIKHYHHIEEYRKNLLVIDKENKEVVFEFTPIKELLKKQNDFKLKPNKIEKRIWWIIAIISLSLIILTPILTFAIPTLIPATTVILLLETKIIISVTSAALGTIFKGSTSIFSTAIKKVESWWYNKLCKNQEKKEKEKKEYVSIIKNLTNNKVETKLETQFNILKQELDNRKNKKTSELINDKIKNHNPNIRSLNNTNNFDSFIRDIANHHQSSTNTRKYHSHSML